MHSFDIPEGNAIESLKAVARQAGVDIVFDSRVVGDLQTPAVRGSYSALEAFQMLLRDSSLVVIQDSNTTAFAVRRESGYAAASVDQGELAVKPTSDKERTDTDMTPTSNTGSPTSQSNRSGNKPTKKNIFSKAAAIITLGTTSLLLGQDDVQVEGPTIELETFKTKGFRSALQQALESKRESNQVSDSVSAEEIGKFSDFNVTDALSRISGVQISREYGEGETANLRGLDGSFARVEVDGRKLSATRDNNQPERSTVLTSFSTELFDSIEVIKSPTAADVEGGIGGIIRLRTPSPLKIGKNTFGAEYGLSTSDQYDFTQTNFNGFVNRVMADNKFGFLLSWVFRKDDNAFNEYLNRRSPRLVSDLADFEEYPELAPYADAYVSRRSRYRDRTGEENNQNFNLKLEYQVNDNLQLYAGGTYSFEDRNKIEAWLRVDADNGDLAPLSVLFPDATEPIIVNEQNAVMQTAWVDGRLYYEGVTDELENTLFGYNFGFNWDASERLHLKLDVSSSESEETRDFYQSNVRYDGVTAGYSYLENPYLPAITILDWETEMNGPLGERLDNLRLSNRIVSEDDSAIRFDANYDLDQGFIKTVSAGFRFSDLETERLRVRPRSDLRRNNDFSYGDAYAMFPLTDPVANLFGNNLPGDTPLDWPVIDTKQTYLLSPSDDAYQFFDLDVAEPPQFITEDTTAYYIMADYEAESEALFVRGNFGMRFVDTETAGNGVITINQQYFETDSESGELVPVDDQEVDIAFLSPTNLDASSSNALPSFNIALSRERNSNFLVRAAVARTETRPSFGDLSPLVDISQVFEDGVLQLDESEIAAGNPALEPFLADMYDIGFEYYFGDSREGLFALSYYHKDLDSVFEDFVVDGERTVSYNGVDYTVGSSDQPINAGSAVVNGFEFAFQTPFTALPDFWQDFGFFGNYTYVTKGELTTLAGDVEPFFGASEDTYNLAFYYEKRGFSGRIGYNYRGAYRLDTTEYVGNSGRTDLAFRYRLDNGWRFAFDVINVTGEQRVTYHSHDDNPGVPIDTQPTKYDWEEPIYKFSVGYSY